MSVQVHSDEFKKWIASEDIFDIDIWWDPAFDEGFVTFDNFEKQMLAYAEYGITSGIISAMDGKNFDYIYANNQLAELLPKVPGFYGCMTLVPEVAYCEDKGEAYIRSLKDKGFVASRMFPKTYTHSMQEYTIGPLLDTLEKLGIPLMIWHVECTFDDFDRICANHPNLNVIVESHDRKLLYHARDYVGLMRKHKNFFVETHNLILFNEFKTLDDFGCSSQLIYGSDFPYMTPHFSLYPIKEADISDEKKRNILAGTARGIFPIE